MPIYLYRCKCGQEFSYFQHKPEPAATRQCSTCGEQAPRIETAANFTVKGFNATNGYSK